MVDVAQLVRASDCDSEGRGFESRLSPKKLSLSESFFYFPSGTSVNTRAAHRLA